MIEILGVSLTGAIERRRDQRLLANVYSELMQKAADTYRAGFGGRKSTGEDEVSREIDERFETLKAKRKKVW